MWLPALRALLLAALLPATIAGQPVRTPRVLLIGLDGADWQTIGPLIAVRRLPAFEALAADGRTAILQATPPLVSPLLWTTVATGQRPEDHGVLDFMVDLPSGEQAPVGVASRRVPALWNIISNAGRSASVVGWWATWPAEQVRGTIVSDRVAPQLFRARSTIEDGSIAPKEATAVLRPLITTPDRVSRADVEQYVPLTAAEYAAAQRAGGTPTLLYQNPIAHLTTVIAATRTYGAITEHLVRSDQPDLLAVYFEGIDTVSHLFVRDPARGPQAIARAYEDADRLIGRLAAAASPDTLVIVCSDHGFYGPAAAIREDPSHLAGPATAWHRPYGILATIEAGRLTRAMHDRSAARSVASAPTTVVSPLDVTPTVLHALGLAVSREMPGRVLDELLPGAAHGRGRAVAWVTKYESPDRSVSETISPGVDPSAKARLQALGYIGAVGSSLAGQNLGEVLYRAGRLEAAERQLVAVIERQPANVAAHLWLAKTRRDLGRPQQALSNYERVLRLDPGAGEALLEAVDVALAAESFERAKSMLAAYRGTGRGDIWARTAAGTIAAAEESARVAEREFRAALAADPLAYEPLSRLVDLMIAARRATDALPAVRAAIARAPDSPRHQALLGETLLAAGEPAGAEAAFERALVLVPDSFALRLELARAQIARHHPAQAIETLGPVPTSPDRSRLLGAAFSALNRWKEAAAEFRAALTSAASIDLFNGLGWAEYKQGRNREAIEAFQRSLALKPDQPRIRELLATLKASRTLGTL